MILHDETMILIHRLRRFSQINHDGIVVFMKCLLLSAGDRNTGGAKKCSWFQTHL